MGVVALLPDQPQERGRWDLATGCRDDEISDSESLPVLTASEIGAYAFCGEAWYLRRRQVPHADFGERRLQQGTVAHRQIGKRTERLRGIERLRVVLLAVTIILLAVVAIQFGARLP